MFFRTLPLLLIIILGSCQQRQFNLTALYGKWTLDSLSTPTGKFDAGENKFEQITFLKNGNFIYTWMNDDVGGEYKGSFFINENPTRNCKTITLISDLINVNPNTIRHYFNFDILRLSDKKLKMLGQTQFLDRGDKTLIYTPTSIFRKD
jgi:hypothetical protein